MAYISNKKLEKIWEEIMIELYKNSTPSADFLELEKNAILNDRGEKIIDFDAHEIDKYKAEKIFDEILKKHKVNSKWNRDVLSFNVWLGCSPRFKPLSDTIKTTEQELKIEKNATNI